MDDAYKVFTQGLPASQRAEFLNAVREAGIHPQDAELIKFLKALQLYKAFYEQIPSQIVEAHRDILEETKTVRNQTKVLADQTAAAAASVATQCAAVTKALAGVDGQAIANRVQTRLDKEVYQATLKGLQGIVDKANAAERSVHRWQRASLAGIWFSAFILTGLLWGAFAAWFYFHHP